MSANDFKTDLRWSEAQHAQDWWEPFYKKAFPLMSSIVTVSGPCPAQKAGVDKFVRLTSGKTIAVDEKIRRDRAPVDICLEVEHVYMDGRPAKPGWVASPNQFTDFMAMGFQAYQIAFFFPFPTLQAAWLKHGASWRKRFSIPPSPNPRVMPVYHTHNVCVPTEILMGNLLDAMRVQL